MKTRRPSRPKPRKPDRPHLPHRVRLTSQPASPRSIFCRDPGGGHPDSDWPRALVTDDDTLPELLIGRAKLRRLLVHRPDEPTPVYRVAARTEKQREAISGLDGWQYLAQLGAGLSALHEAGMGLEQMREVVVGIGPKSDTSRLIVVYRENPDLFRRADLSRGKLTQSHLAALGRARAAEREELAGQVLHGNLSVRELLARIRNPPAVTDADMDSLARQLSETLGTDVTLRTTVPGAGEIAFAWHSAEALQGVMHRLAGSPGAPSPTASEAGAADHGLRWLVIPFATLDEFDALFGHLIQA